MDQPLVARHPFCCPAFQVLDFTVLSGIVSPLLHLCGTLIRAWACLLRVMRGWLWVKNEATLGFLFSKQLLRQRPPLSCTHFSSHFLETEIIM